MVPCSLLHPGRSLQFRLHRGPPMPPTVAPPDSSVALLLGGRISRDLTRERVVAYLAGAFAVLTLVLSSLGLYGVLSYGVARRTREIGVRTALGATGSKVIGLVLRGSFRITAIGVALGLVGASREPFSARPVVRPRRTRRLDAGGGVRRVSRRGRPRGLRTRPPGGPHRSDDRASLGVTTARPERMRYTRELHHLETTRHRGTSRLRSRWRRRN